MNKRKFSCTLCESKFGRKRIEVRPFYDDYEEQDKPYVELTFEEWQEKLSTCGYGYMKAYINSEVVEIEDPEVVNTIEYQNILKEQEIDELKRYLSDTDYVIKLNEAKIEDENLFNSLKTEYSDILTKRKEARARINELENK